MQSAQAMQAAAQKNFEGTRLRSLRSPPAENFKNVFVGCPMPNLCKNHIILLICLSLLFASCASVASVDDGRQPVTFPSVEDVTPVWREFAGGVDFFHGRTGSPRLEFWAVKIDLSSREIEIITKGGVVKNGITHSAKVSSFVRDNNLIAGINAVPFDISSSIEGQAIKNIGIVVSNGILIAPANPNYDALVFYKDGTAAIVSQSSINSIANIENAAGGFHAILANGELTPRTQNNEARHPRSAAGISADGRYLYLLVIDGRRAQSEGATENETALLLRSLGSWNAINFDGGGSSALAMRFPDGGVRAVNTPIHLLPGQERAVAGCIGVRSSSW
ncbi:MAG: phosphodiester glycosidase family protein [Treponema sp.]|nr:phosphodiester glycosidase family protein [Treponema sp.]MCL2237706.1 phosphodiester glycosidase family protein [Treponema sp.]